MDIFSFHNASIKQTQHHAKVLPMKIILEIWKRFEICINGLIVKKAITKRPNIFYS